MIHQPDIEALRAMTIPAHYPRIAAEAAARVAEARDPKRAAVLLSVDEIHALALVGHALLEPAYRAGRWSRDAAAGRPHARP